MHSVLVLPCVRLLCRCCLVSPFVSLHVSPLICLRDRRFGTCIPFWLTAATSALSPHLSPYSNHYMPPQLVACVIAFWFAAVFLSPYLSPHLSPHLSRDYVDASWSAMAWPRWSRACKGTKSTHHLASWIFFTTLLGTIGTTSASAPPVHLAWLLALGLLAVVWDWMTRMTTPNPPTTACGLDTSSLNSPTPLEKPLIQGKWDRKPKHIKT